MFIPCYLSKMYLGHKFRKWIGGQTGDCAGAVQQLAEVIFYLSCIVTMEIFLIRHTTPKIEKGICYGQTDLDITTTFSRGGQCYKTTPSNNSAYRL